MSKITIIAAAIIGLGTATLLHAQEREPGAEMSVEQQKVSRLPPLPQPLDPIMQEMFDDSRAKGGAVINLNIVTGHAPKFAQASRARISRCLAGSPRRVRRHQAHAAGRRRE